jgi:hypothetical protein
MFPKRLDFKNSRVSGTDEHLTDKVLIPDVPFIIPVHTVALDCPIRPAKRCLIIDL